MSLIKKIAQQALKNGCLSTTDKSRIQFVWENSCDSEDIDALIILERAILAGEVAEESSNLGTSPGIKNKSNSTNISMAYQIAAELAATAAMALAIPRNLQDRSFSGT